MMRPEQWEIWDALVRFEDSPEIKQRPVLIYNNIGYVLISYKITGTNRGDNECELRIRNWEEAGLDKPSSVRIEKMLRLRPDDLLGKRGKLSDEDILLFKFRLK